MDRQHRRQPGRTDRVATGRGGTRLSPAPDATELRAYREGYNAAIKANDAFAARFYLDLFPPPDGLIRAEAIVAPLFARLLLRDDVLAALQAQPAADPEIQAACLKLAGTWPEFIPKSTTMSPGPWFAIPGGRKRIASAACAWPGPPAGSNLNMALISIPWAWPSTAPDWWPRRWRP